jgi:hypothetical protein
MSRRNQFLVLGSLLVVLGIMMYSQLRPAGNSANAASADGQFALVNVDNPALRIDILNRFLNLQYKGTHRNIFSATAPPPPPVEVKAAENVPPPHPVPTGPPPLAVEAKYFGSATDAMGNNRRAFFATANNEEVIFAGEGDTILGRFRVVRLTNTTADVEEIASGRHATMTVEEPGPN